MSTPYQERYSDDEKATLRALMGDALDAAEAFSLDELEAHAANKRGRAQRRYKDMGICQRCQAALATDRQHAHGNLDDIEDIMFLCRHCHMEMDGRLDALADIVRQRPRSTHCKRGHERVEGATHCQQCNTEWARHNYRRKHGLSDDE